MVMAEMAVAAFFCVAGGANAAAVANREAKTQVFIMVKGSSKLAKKKKGAFEK
jgi:hypothetical protein